MGQKQIKRNWHRENKVAAYKLTNGECSACGHIGKFSIHHTSYNLVNGKSVYSFEFEELHKRRIVIVLCYTCHKKEHLENEKNIDYCFYCKKVTSKTRSLSLKIPVTICKKCFKEKKHLGSDSANPNNQLTLF